MESQNYKNTGVRKTAPPKSKAKLARPRKELAPIVIVPYKGKNPKQIVKVQKNPKIRQVSIVPTAIGAKTAVPIIAEFDNVQYSATFAALYSFLASKQLYTDQSESKNDAFQNAAATVYMFNSMLPMITGVNMALTNAPIIVWDIITALKAKSVRFLTYGHAMYSWGSINQTLVTAITTPGGVWEPTYITGDTGNYNSPATIASFSGTPTMYAILLQKMADLSDNKRMQIKDDKYRSVLTADVSTFARSYVYNGDYISPTGGFYKDIESEVNITAPSLASYGVYGAQDLRAPLKLTPYSGDGATAFGHPLHPTFLTYFNKRPPSYKLIDFEWVYYTLVNVAVAAIEKLLENSGKTQTGPLFNYTEQDFRIMLRQALMTVFDTQYFVQFITPLRFSSNENGFAPFHASGGTCPNVNFSHMLVPKLIQENLAALRARTYKNPNDKSQNATCFIPVLGRYIEDVPAFFTYKGSDGNTWDVFNNAISQQNINLVNGASSASQYVNLNSNYYQGMLSDWNTFMQDVSTVTTITTTIAGDGGPPGLGILFYTAVQDLTTLNPGPDNNAGAQPKLVKALRNVKNATRTFEKGPKGLPTAIPPASIATLTTTQTTTNFNYSSAVAAMYDSLITPQIRLDINSPEDQLSLQMYQCEVREPVATSWNTTLSNTGSGLASRLYRLALMCVPGIARDSSSEYDAILEMLSMHNEAGMLSSILGGFAKSILPPDAHGIVDVISDLVPF